MNIVNKVTLQHLKQNKRRTLVTILGVIVSVAMITAVSTISGSFMDMLQRHTVAETGDWHVRYEGITSDKLTAIRQDSNTKHITVSKDKGYAKLEGSRHSQRPYLYVTQYDTEGMQSLPVTLIQGRYPRNDNEIVISEQTIRTSSVEYEVGDVITLDLGYRVSDIGRGLLHYLGQEDALTDNEYFVTSQTRQYTVTGIIDASKIDRSWHPGYVAISSLDVDKLPPSEKCAVAVGLKSVSRHIYENAADLAQQVDASKVGYNTRLLIFYGVTDDGHLRDTFVIATAIVGVIILIGSVSLIYNAFAISLSERSRYLGMLSSIGATKQQKRNSVFFEGFVVGIIAIPIGVLCGILGIGMTFACVNPIVQNVFGVTEPLELVLLPSALCGAVLFSILMIAISAWVPARRASRIAPIDAIRQSQDITVKPGDVRTWRLTSRVFGFEAELGLKNLKRNKYRYRATLFSLTISVVLFLVSSAFTFYMKKSFDMTQTELDFDVAVFVQARGDQPYEQYLAQISHLESINSATVIERLYTSTYLPSEKATEDVKSRIQSDDGLYRMMLDIVALDDNSLAEYARLTGTDYDTLQDGSLKGILLNSFTLREHNTFTTVTPLLAGPGDEIPFSMWTGEREVESRIKILGVTDQLPPGIRGYQESIVSVTMVVGKEALRTLRDQMNEGDRQSRRYLWVYLSSDDPMALERDIEEVKLQYPGLSTETYNAASGVESSRQFAILVSVFIYGFIVLMSLVCVANIMNTVSTGVALRKREFAMLRSIGITPKGFRKMIDFESLFCGIKALAYGLPISFCIMFLEYRTLQMNFAFKFILPWRSVFVAIIAVFAVVGTSMLYASRKMGTDNIVDVLKSENI